VEHQFIWISTPEETKWGWHS